jgi:ribosomal protein L37AE/L43A
MIRRPGSIRNVPVKNVPGHTKKTFNVELDSTGRILWPKKLKITQLPNGKFADCPFCGQTMAANVDGSWWCYMGCGSQVREKAGTPKHILDKGIRKSVMTVTYPPGFKTGARK